MDEFGAYGQRLGDRFRLTEARSIVTRILKKAELAVTEIRGDASNEHGLSEPIPKEDAYLIGVQLLNHPEHQYWEDGRQTKVVDLRAGETLLYDLKRNPVVLLDKPFHSLHFYLSRAALLEIADEAEAPPIGELNYSPGVGVEDPTMVSLARAMQAVLERPEQVSRVFVDHVNMAFAAHVAHAYGGMARRSLPSRGGLASWQQTRAREILESKLDGSIALKDLARECGLSVSHFARAFRHSTGLSPHQWLLERRIEKAKELLKQGDMPLSDVALTSGFADQSHFTRVFGSRVGVPPGIWKRNFGAG